LMQDMWGWEKSSRCHTVLLLSKRISTILCSKIFYVSCCMHNGVALLIIYYIDSTDFLSSSRQDCQKSTATHVEGGQVANKVPNKPELTICNCAQSAHCSKSCAGSILQDSTHVFVCLLVCYKTRASPCVKFNLTRASCICLVL